MSEFNSKEIAKHKTKADLWVSVRGQVLDVTKYVDEHPGGADVLLECAGTDATAAFEDAGHSEDAVEIMQRYIIGTLEGKKPVSLAPKAPEVLIPSSPETQTPKKLQLAGLHMSYDQAFGLGMVLVGAVAAVGLARHPRDHPSGTVEAAKLISHLHWQDWAKSYKISGFAGGFLSASSVFAVVSFIGARKLTAIMNFGSGGRIMTLPKTIKAQRSVAPDMISVRGFLEPKAYQSLPLVGKTEVAPNVYHFVFALPTERTVLGLPCGQHVAIKADIDGQSVSRSYTPVSNNTDFGRLELVIRCYPDGLLTGRYLQQLQIGDDVEFRGPKGPMRYHRGLAGKIGMIAGGTGITPMYQLIRAICEDDEDLTKVSLIYANRSEGDMLLRKELDAFARRYPQNFKLWYMVDKASPGWSYGVGYVTGQTMTDHLPAAAADVKIMLCGPPGMVNASKKTLASMGFAMPGAVAKMTDQIFLF